MTTSAEQIRAYSGPALFSYGFRPFFLFGALWAALAVALWLPLLWGELSLPITFSPLDWHVHELLYGYVPAVVAGFLMTAVPNWTGRLPVVGPPLAGLFALWVAGRVAVLASGLIGATAAAVIDVSFLAVLGLVMGREIVAGKNHRNLKVLGVVGVLLAGNVVFHIEAGLNGANYGTRLGIAATITLIMLIGGRIIPSFTRNWLARREPGRLPIAFERTDGAIIAASVVALAAWVVVPSSYLTALLCLLAFALNVWRLARWAGDRTIAEPLVLVLHAAFIFVPLGFGLVALAIMAPSVVTSTGALHAWTAGAVGMMTLAVMTRASFGHTGQPLVATPAISAIFLAAATAALMRIAAAFHVAPELTLAISAIAWVAAFAGFVLVYAPLLARARS